MIGLRCRWFVSIFDIGILLICFSLCAISRVSARDGHEAERAPNSFAASGVFLTIAGPWRDRNDLVERLQAANSNNIVLNDDVLVEISSGLKSDVIVTERRPDLARQMETSSAGRIDKSTLVEIDRHNITAVLHVDASGKDFRQRLEFAVSALRRAGGYAVMVEKAGMSHDWAHWDEILSSTGPLALYKLLIVHVGEDHRKCSFGMKQFGLPDACIDESPSDLGMSWLLAGFNIYQWTATPKLDNGHTFSMDASGPRYFLKHGFDDRYPPGHPFLNPHGVWYLSRDNKRKR